MRKEMGKTGVIFLALMLLGSSPGLMQGNLPEFTLKCGDCLAHTFIIRSNEKPEGLIAEQFRDWLVNFQITGEGGEWKVTVRLCPPKRTPSGVYVIRFTFTNVPTQSWPSIVVRYLACRKNIEIVKEFRPRSRVEIVRAETSSKKAKDLCQSLALRSDDESKRKYESCCNLSLNLAQDYLKTAQKHFFGGNYIAANYWALKAVATFENIIECTGG